MKKLIFITLLLITMSCQRDKEEICKEDYTMVSYIPTYLSCDPLRQEYTYRIDTAYTKMEDSCECKYHTKLLMDSFWDRVDEKAKERQFMYYEVPLRHLCKPN